MGEKDSYPTLLGSDWDCENYIFIDIKKDTMNFKSDGMKVTQPLDPYKGPRYTEPKNDNMEIDAINYLYTSTVRKQVVYTNPIADGSVSWRSFQ
jgi:hypothetical protein